MPQAEAADDLDLLDNGTAKVRHHQDPLKRSTEHMSRLVDPAFQGLGLGLATAKRILDRHQGRLWIESTSGVGTTVFFSLPASQAPS
jgi:signal transduction histidine kinase